MIKIRKTYYTGETRLGYAITNYWWLQTIIIFQGIFWGSEQQSQFTNNDLLYNIEKELFMALPPEPWGHDTFSLHSWYEKVGGHIHMGSSWGSKSGAFSSSWAPSFGSAQSSWGMVVGASGPTPCADGLAPGAGGPAPCASRPAPCADGDPAPCTSGSAPCASGPAPCAGDPAPCARGPVPCVRCPAVCNNCLKPFVWFLELGVRLVVSVVQLPELVVQTLELGLQLLWLGLQLLDLVFSSLNLVSSSLNLVSSCVETFLRDGFDRQDYIYISYRPHTPHTIVHKVWCSWWTSISDLYFRKVDSRWVLIKTY